MKPHSINLHQVTDNDSLNNTCAENTIVTEHGFPTKQKYCIPCVQCGKVVTIMAYEADLDDYKHGRKLVQHSFTYLKPDEREILLSGICGTCWNKMFPNQ